MMIVDKAPTAARRMMPACVAPAVAAGARAVLEPSDRPGRHTPGMGRSSVKTCLATSHGSSPAPGGALPLGIRQQLFAPGDWTALGRGPLRRTPNRRPPLTTSRIPGRRPTRPGARSTDISAPSQLLAEHGLGSPTISDGSG